MTLWTRPNLEVTQPNRAIGGIYRSADVLGEGGVTLGGVPLQTTADAVVATVKLGYKVADTQIERSRRLAKNLRGAAKRAGARDEAQLLTNVEGLMTRAMLTGLEWLEGSATDVRSPVRRLAKAEYRLIGRMLGLLADETPSAASPSASPAAADTLSARAPSSAAFEGPATKAAAVYTAPASSPPPTPTPKPLRLLHKTGSARKAVTFMDWCVDSELTSVEPFRLEFHLRGPTTGKVLVATLVVEAEKMLLIFETDKAHPSGRWRAAVCAADGEQLGHVDVEL